jgi:hypothetical protein
MRKLLGWYLHTLQDFYSHSNYVSLQNPPIIRLGDVPLPSQPSFSFPCLLPGTLSDNGKKDLLTTGWALVPLVAGIAPLGQCAHGLVVNGIHKDWKGRDDHDMARAHAILATRNFVYSIITDSSITNKNNVCLLMTDEPCQTTTPLSCDDLSPNITASARTINTPGVTKTQPGPISVSVSDSAASASASGIKGSVTVSASGSDQVGGSALSGISYTDSLQITSPGKSGSGQAILTLNVGASATCGGINTGISRSNTEFAFYNLSGNGDGSTSLLALLEL